MDILDAIKRLEDSKEFKGWKSKNEGFYLAHVFKMMDEANKDAWQIGYYNPGKDRMVNFICSHEILITPETEVFKEPGKSINQLDTSKVKVDSEQALKIMQDCLDKNYSNVDIMKNFFILQNLPQSGTVYNITVLTRSFKTVNIKIDAETGDIKSHKEVSLIEQQK